MNVLGRSLNEDQVIQLLGDGNFSDIEDFEDVDDEIQPSTFENLQLDDPEPEPQPFVEPSRNRCKILLDHHN
ncbi:unnamed protein product [Parnassius apollo]|uniref:(apollo) hypothetical protein n=1 Tax=Parnassius apollo TaxID=110799 RepID=A0A8S3XLJ4_PARAO|nr:unnamed protein product [Parnassius apollo]